MTFKIHPRSFASALLHSALKIAPPYAAEWGRAMLGELHHVEGEWAALAWAVGGTGVLLKHAFLSLIIPGHANQIAPSEGEFFAKEKPMRKSTLIGAAACLVASLLFFAAPAFRQAFQLSLTQWQSLFESVDRGYGNPYRDPSPDFTGLAERARKNHDAEGLAFAALHRRFKPDSAALADEAVRIDPQLTWIYAILAGGYTRPSKERIAKLEAFDPQNAMPHLLEAEMALANYNLHGKFVFNDYLSDPAWLNAMAAAFASSKIDTYRDRVAALDRRVASLDGEENPYQAENEYFLTAGAPMMGNPGAYVKLLLQSGDGLDARGNHARAEKQYRLAAHFGEMVQASNPQGIGAFRNGTFAASLLQDPYHRLAAIYQRHGDDAQAGRFAGLAANADQRRQAALNSFRALLGGTARERWNADILGVCGIVMFACLAVLPICTIVTVLRSRSIRLSKLRVGHATAALASSAVIGLLISTAGLYFSYRPYANIVRAYLRDGDSSRLLTLSAFLSNINYSATPPVHETLYSLWTFPMYFWAGIIVLCGLALVFTTAKFVWQHRQPVATI